MAKANGGFKGTVDTAELHDAVGRVVKCIEPKPPMPVLKGILMEAGRGVLTLSAGNFDVAGSANVRIRGGVTGRALVDGDQLARIVRSLRGGMTTIALRKQQLVITSRRATFRLLTMPVSDFPSESFEKLADASNHADKVKAAGRVGDWKPKPVKTWKPPTPTALFEPEPFGIGDWIQITHPFTGEVERGQMWTKDAAVFETGEGNVLRELGSAYRKGDPLSYIFSRQTGVNEHGHPTHEHKTVKVERVADPSYEQLEALDTPEGNEQVKWEGRMVLVLVAALMRTHDYKVTDILATIKDQAKGVLTGKYGTKFIQGEDVKLAENAYDWMRNAGSLPRELKWIDREIILRDLPEAVHTAMALIHEYRTHPDGLALVA